MHTNLRQSRWFGSKARLAVLLPVVAFLCLFAVPARAQSHWSAPPEPRVKPEMPLNYPEDPQRTRIEDALRDKSNRALGGESNRLVEVRLVFTNQITQTQIDDFEKLGGKISYIFQTVSYGARRQFCFDQGAQAGALVSA